MRYELTYLVLFTILSIVMLISNAKAKPTSIGNKSNKSYPNTYSKDIDIDAPWYVANEISRIPVQFFIKDADVMDLEELQGLYIEIPHSCSGFDFSVTDTIYTFIYSPVLEDMDEHYWSKIAFIPLPEGYHSGQTLYIKATIDYEDGLPWDEYFSKVLAIKIGYSGLPKFDDWYQGDCHYHTSFTDNPYEFGGTFDMIYYSSRMMGLDFITTSDHASDSCSIFGIIVDDLNLSDWLAIPDSIAIYGNVNPIIIRGEEAEVRNIASARNHLLIYGNDSFFSAPITDGEAEKTHDDAWDFIDSSPEAIAYAAHPYNPDYLWEFSVLDAAFRRGSLTGLQVWNERSVFEIDVDMDTYCDPFPFTGGEMTRDGIWDADLLDGIDQWDYFLWLYIYEASFSEPIKVFIDGGSDAHGDFNYFTYYPFIGSIPSPDIAATDNAFAKVRTLAYCPDTLNQESIMNALRKGNIVVTDGPILKFETINHGPDFSENAIIGETDTVFYGSHDSLLIEYKGAQELGGVIEQITLKKIHPLSATSEDISLDTFVTGLEGNFKIPLDLPIEEGWCCYRIEATTFDEGEQYVSPETSFRCYTNPIWFYVFPDTEYVSIDQKSSREKLFLNVFPNPFNSQCKIHSNDGALIEVFDAIGQKLTHLRKNKPIWKPKHNHKSGLYFIRATKGNQHVVQKAIYLK